MAAGSKSCITGFSAFSRTTPLIVVFWLLFAARAEKNITSNKVVPTTIRASTYLFPLCIPLFLSTLKNDVNNLHLFFWRFAATITLRTAGYFG